MPEIRNLNFEKEDGNPHLAVTHVAQNYSANMRPDALLLKGGKVNQEVIKSMKGVLPEKELEKMSHNNMRMALEEALEEIMRQADEYVWVYVEDFNEDMVVFRFEGKSYAVSHSIDEAGTITFGQDPVEVKRRDLYVETETGEELMKAADWFKKDEDPVEGDSENPEAVVDGVDNGETVDTPSDIKEEDMSDENNVAEVETVEEFKKSAEFQELVKAAIEADRAEREAIELEKATTEILKGMAFIAEDEAEAITKAIMVTEGSEKLLKALTDAQEMVEKAQKEAEEVKKEFGEKEDAEESAPVIEKSARSHASLKEQVAAYKASKK